MNYPRRQQHRRARHAVTTAVGAIGALGLALVAAALGALLLALVVLAVAVGLAAYSRRWLRLARRSRVGARSEDQVPRAIRIEDRPLWRMS